MITLTKLLEDAIESRLQSIHTAIPARVESVDFSKNKISAKPLIKKQNPDGTFSEYPVIPNVPLMTYRAGNAFIQMPIESGDFVLLIFMECSIEEWTNKNGGIVEPKDPRRFDLTDAIAIPGVFPFSNPVQGANSTDLIIKNDDASVVVKTTSLELYGNTDAIALASKVDSAISAIVSYANSHTHITTCGAGAGTAASPVPPLAAQPQVGSLKVKAE